MQMFVAIVAGFICLGGALGVVGLRNPVHNALSLVATLFGVAVLFVSQQAYFLAAIQVIVYAGAVVVLFLFVIMLLGVDKVERLEPGRLKGQAVAAGITAAAVGILVLVALLAGTPEITGQPGAGLSGRDINEMAKSIFTDNVWAFEITSALLAIAVVAAVLLAGKPKGGYGDTNLLDGDDYPETESVFDPAPNEETLTEEPAAQIDWLVEVPTQPVAGAAGAAGTADDTGGEGR